MRYFPVFGVVFLALTPTIAWGGDDPLVAVITTIYKGDRPRAERQVIALRGRYASFLQRFENDSYCKKTRAGCKRVKKSELELIENNKWSREFEFSAADFYDSLGIYNLEKRLRITNHYQCRFTLQLTADLGEDEILNDEYLADCR